MWPPGSEVVPGAFASRGDYASEIVDRSAITITILIVMAAPAGRWLVPPIDPPATDHRERHQASASHIGADDTRGR